MKRFLIFFISLLFSMVGQAKELTQFGETTRSFGMGGVRVPMDGHDAGAFLWNPANLTYVKGMNLEVFNFNLEPNSQLIEDSSNPPSLSGINSLGPLYGKHYQLSGEGYASFTLPFFGVAVYDQGLLDFQLHNPAYPELDMTYLNDYAFVLGGSVPLGPDGSFGINVKRIDRLGGPQVLGPAVLNVATQSSTALLDQFQNEGVGYGIDAGVMYKVPLVPLNPTFSLAWQDVGSTAFIQTKGLDAPDRIKDDLTLSATFHTESLLGGLAGGIEYRHITDADEQLGKKIFVGAELSLLMFDVRAGFYQGYTTYGAGVDLWLMKLDAALYTVETGAYPGQTPDQRYQVGLSMNFSFDPDFNLTDSNGKKRHLKQRR